MRKQFNIASLILLITTSAVAVGWWTDSRRQKKQHANEKANLVQKYNTLSEKYEHSVNSAQRVIFNADGELVSFDHTVDYPGVNNSISGQSFFSILPEGLNKRNIPIAEIEKAQSSGIPEEFHFFVLDIETGEIIFDKARALKMFEHKISPSYTRN